MDLVGLQKTLERFNEETIPKLEQLIVRLERLANDDLHAVLDRLDGTRIKVEVAIPPRDSVRP